jgi:starvation-inducible DNA-binding protein
MDTIAIDRALGPVDAILAVLQSGLASSVDLAVQARQALWNASGPERGELHQFLGVVADEAATYSDLIADRIQALGGVAEGTAQIAAARSQLPSYPLHINGTAAHVGAISRALSSFALALLSTVEAVAGMGDAATAEFLMDLRQEVSRLARLVEVRRQG